MAISSVRRSKVDSASAAALGFPFSICAEPRHFLRRQKPFAVGGHGDCSMDERAEAKSTITLEIVAGATLALRLSRWRSAQTLREPLLWSLHVGYAWLSLGLLIESFNGLFFNYCRKKPRCTR